ncbi:MAG TPA: hypothetical protein VE973_03700 [Candidatus Limnocylindria bacterium]|nr:hypothetical protein [Candidatus Limnocylindria bacterium]
MKPEILKISEKPKKTATESLAAVVNFDEEQIQTAIAPRKALLESIKAEITLKSYYTLEEKILVEEKRLNDILDIKRGRQSRLAKYSFILNPSYFEQEFLN